MACVGPSANSGNPIDNLLLACAVQDARDHVKHGSRLRTECDAEASYDAVRGHIGALHTPFAPGINLFGEALRLNKLITTQKLHLFPHFVMPVHVDITKCSNSAESD
eukprot:1298440-Amphidinium_carterae.1